MTKEPGLWGRCSAAPRVGWLALSALLSALACGGGDSGPGADADADDASTEAESGDVLEAADDAVADEAPTETGETETGADADVETDVEDDVDAETGDGGPACGNGLIEGTEACDGDDLRGLTCEGLGFTRGTLGCSGACELDLSGCASDCGNGRCERGDTALGCPAECAVRDVSAGAFHTCAALADGSARCWGGWTGHRIGGAGDLPAPLAVPGVAGAVRVCAGEAHTCFAAGDGTVSCWGRNGFGEAGQDLRDVEVFPSAVVPGVTGAGYLSCGRFHTCAGDGSTGTCWGRNDYGQLGTERTTRHRDPVPITIGREGVRRLEAGGRHTCGYGTRSSTSCFGYGGSGALGRGDFMWQTDQAGSIGALVAAVTAGESHSCMISGLDDSVLCWGADDYGQVGVAGPALINTPVATGVTGAQAVSAGLAHTCAIVGATIACWGANTSGQLGNGTTTSTHLPQTLSLAATVVSAGDAHTCALLTDGTVRCWGDNLYGQLGIASSERMRAEPVEPVGL